jgi:hypothetical protein
VRYNISLQLKISCFKFFSSKTFLRFLWIE